MKRISKKVKKGAAPLRKALALALTASLAGGLSACAKTPDSSVVARKNSDRLREEAQKEPDTESALGATAKKAPEHYEYTWENTDETLRVVADADVWLPDKDAIPMYEVEGAEFSQELATKIYNYFFEGKETYRLEGSDLTKDKCQERILEQQELIAQTEADDTLSEEEKNNLLEEYRNRLTDYQSIYEDLPDEPTIQKIPVDDTLVKAEYMQSIDGSECYWINCQTDTEHFMLVNWPRDSSGASDLSYWKSGAYEYSGQLGEQLLSDAEKKEAGEQIGIPYSEAKADADDFFESIGIEVEAVASFAVKGIFNEQQEDVISGADEATAFRFVYTRGVDGIPLAATSSHEVPEENAAVMWCYEQIQVYVDRDGIVRTDWEFPIDVKETVSDNVGILSFDAASEIFEKMMPIVYEGDLDGQTEDVQWTIDVEVNQVNLALMRVRDSGGKRTGVLTPAWVFYGTVTHHYHTDNVYEDTGGEQDWDNTTSAPWIVLSVNAVDGSVIDVVEGY